MNEIVFTSQTNVTTRKARQAMADVRAGRPRRTDVTDLRRTLLAATKKSTSTKIVMTFPHVEETYHLCPINQVAPPDVITTEEVIRDTQHKSLMAVQVGKTLFVRKDGKFEAQ